MQTICSRGLVEQFRGKADADVWAAFALADPELVAKVGREILANVPPSFGSCAMLTAACVSLLRARQQLPAIAVAGDLAIRGKRVFVAQDNLPSATSPGVFTAEWDGHCWVEVGGFIAELSLFRSARALNPTHHLARYVDTVLGKRTGLLVTSPADLLSLGLQYVPRYVLTDQQVEDLVAGLGYLLANGA